MSRIDIMFCRRLLSEAHKLVKIHFPRIHLTKDAWVYNLGRGHWEFHGPDKFYWHGNADNAYDTRYKGWMAYLRYQGLDEKELEDVEAE